MNGPAAASALGHTKLPPSGPSTWGGPVDDGDIGGTWPTPDREATAHRLRTLHTADGGRCWWCGKHWPCPDERWADTVLRRASALGGR